MASPTKRPSLEHADDPRRGAHVKDAQRALSMLEARRVPCTGCTSRATRLITSRGRPIVVCATCAGQWRRLSPLNRRQWELTAARMHKAERTI